MGCCTQICSIIDITDVSERKAPSYMIRSLIKILHVFQPVDHDTGHPYGHRAGDRTTLVARPHECYIRIHRAR